MAETKISWTDIVWNPVVGCTKVSAGCKNCYAATLHERRHEAWKAGRFPGAPPQYHAPFSQVQLLPERLERPLHWRKPRRVFVNSVSDLFHENVPDAYLDRIFAVMALSGEAGHVFQILTKRPARMASYLEGRDFCDPANEAFDRFVRPLSEDLFLAGEITWPLENVWLGTSVEDQRAADERIPHLLRTPAAVRFLSCEPLLGPVDLADYMPLVGDRCWDGGKCHHWCESECWRRDFCAPLAQRDFFVDWIIAGGESGSGFRPMDPDWARSLRDQAREHHIPFFFKQSSGARPEKGAMLDGREWREMPPWPGSEPGEKNRNAIEELKR